MTAPRQPTERGPERPPSLALLPEPSLPLAFRLCLLFLLRSDLLLLAALASRQMSGELLQLFYPQPSHLYLGLAVGSPALLVALAAPYRQRVGHAWRHALWRRGRRLCLVSVLADLLLQFHGQTLSHWRFSWPGALLLLTDLACLWYLLRGRGLPALFAITAEPPKTKGHPHG